MLQTICGTRNPKNDNRMAERRRAQSYTIEESVSEDG